MPRLDRREFLKLLSAGAAAGSIPWIYQYANAAALPKDFYKIPKKGNARILHCTDFHGQLNPVFFREPNVNLGMGDAFGRPPHMVGKKLLKRYLEHITLEGYHTTIAAIDSENIACIELHKKFGFTHQGNIRQIARKFDRWLNLEYYQLILSSSPLSDDFETQNQLTQ